MALSDRTLLIGEAAAISRVLLEEPATELQKRASVLIERLIDEVEDLEETIRAIGQGDDY